MSEYPGGGRIGGGGGKVAPAAAAAAPAEEFPDLWGTSQPGLKAKGRGSLSNGNGSKSSFGDGTLDRFLSSSRAAQSNGRRGSDGHKSHPPVAGGAGGAGAERSVRTTVSAAQRSARMQARLAKEARERRRSKSPGRALRVPELEPEAEAESKPVPASAPASPSRDRPAAEAAAMASEPARANAAAAPSSPKHDSNKTPNWVGDIPATIGESKLSRSARPRAAQRPASARDDGPPLTIRIGGDADAGGGAVRPRRGRRRPSRDAIAGAAGGTDTCAGSPGRRSRSLGAMHALERSYMAMARDDGDGAGAAGPGPTAGGHGDTALDRLLDRHHKRPSANVDNGGQKGGGPPKSISVFRSSNSFGSYELLNSLLVMDDGGGSGAGSGDRPSLASIDGISMISLDIDIDDALDNNGRGKGGGEENTGPTEATQSAPKLSSSSQQGEQHRHARMLRRSSTGTSSRGSLERHLSRTQQRRSSTGSRGSDRSREAQLWDAFRKSGRTRSKSVSSDNPYLAFGGGGGAESSSGGLPRRHHSDGEIGARIMGEVGQPDDDGGGRRRPRRGRRRRTFSEDALDRAVKLGLFDEDDVKEVVSPDDNNDSYDLFVGDEFEEELRDNKDEEDVENGDGNPVRRIHSDGMLKPAGVRKSAEYNNNREGQRSGEPVRDRKEDSDRRMRHSDGMFDDILMSRAMRGIGGAVDRDRPPMNITIGGDGPLPSFRRRDDVSKISLGSQIDDEALVAEGEVHTSQHRRAPRRSGSEGKLGGSGTRTSARRGSLR